MQPAMTATWACMFLMIASSGHAKSTDHDQADAQALDLAKEAIALRSVRGDGNQVPQMAAMLKAALVAGGFLDRLGARSLFSGSLERSFVWPRGQRHEAGRRVSSGGAY